MKKKKRVTARNSCLIPPLGDIFIIIIGYIKMAIKPNLPMNHGAHSTLAEFTIALNCFSLGSVPRIGELSRHTQRRRSNYSFELKMDLTIFIIGLLMPTRAATLLPGTCSGSCQVSSMYCYLW